MNRNKLNTSRLASLSILSALSVALHLIEMLIPQFVPIPGFRLGLANLVTLFVLYYYDVLSYIFVSVLKVTLVALLTTGFGINFLMSLSGTFLCSIVSIILFKTLKPSPIGLSSISSVFHTIGQLLFYGLFFNTMYIFSYIVFLGPLSILSGILIGFIVSSLLNGVPKTFKNEEKIKR